MAGEDVTPRMSRAASRLERTVNRALDDAELSPAGYRLMAHLATGGRPATALAEKLAVSRPTVTAVTDWLESRGYVVRTPDTSDRRRVRIGMTEAGRRALAEADDRVGGRLRAVLETLSDDEARLVLDALELLHDALDEHRLREHTKSLAALAK